MSGAGSRRRCRRCIAAATASRAHTHAHALACTHMCAAGAHTPACLDLGSDGPCSCEWHGCASELDESMVMLPMRSVCFDRGELSLMDQ
jgi:hypothetical protein